MIFGIADDLQNILVYVKSYRQNKVGVKTVFRISFLGHGERSLKKRQQIPGLKLQNPFETKE